MSIDPRMSEWGNPPRVMSRYPVPVSYTHLDPGAGLPQGEEDPLPPAGDARRMTAKKERPGRPDRLPGRFEMCIRDRSPATTSSSSGWPG